MSEEVLKALIQLFAIITKQDGGVTAEERNYVINFFQLELDRESVKKYVALYDKAVGYDEDNPDFLKNPGEQRATVEDSVKALQISKRINKTLSQKQKVIVLLRLLELLKADNQLTPIGLEIIDVIATIFNITPGEYGLMKSFVVTDDSFELQNDHFLIITNPSGHPAEHKVKVSEAEIDGWISVLKLDSVNMYFLKYKGNEEVHMNGFTVQPDFVYLLTPGSTLKASQGYSTYYSDIVKFFEKKEKTDKISFNARDLQYKFKKGKIGLHKIDIQESEGTLVGIMGASGSGKTTLLNVISGILTPSRGDVTVNGINVHKDPKNIEGVLGYVSQDDLLIHELTVYQNLYFNAKLSLNDLTETEIEIKIYETLESLGLEHIKDLKVGSVLNKTISGGQRKRLNIALELIRQPAVLFVDEPTSGLSSRDSENVMDLLKELTIRGKLVFVVIHQPSSDIFKMFDKMIVMDTGGYLIYYGNPVETLTYFKEVTHQLDRIQGICPTCGNVNPEQVFNIIEAKVVNEFGEFTSKRKVTPKEWNEIYNEKFFIPEERKVTNKPPVSLSRPNWFMQSVIFGSRDFLSKIADRQYMLISMLSAPLLALVLSFVIRYRSSPAGDSYIFRYNENIPAYFLMSIIVALFIGLSVSAEEIIRDRRILNRERFLNLSWFSYLVSKTGILFIFSAVQTMTFVLIGNSILEIKGMTLMFWLLLFSSACAANMLGLSISSAFKSAVTVYILIPIILIPQMIFSGLLFSFDKLHPSLSDNTEVPVLADMMISRWAMEGMAVYQFKENAYEEPIFEFEQVEHQAEYKTGYWLPEVRKTVNYISNNFFKEDEEIVREVDNRIMLLQNELTGLPWPPEEEQLDINSITRESLSPQILLKVSRYLNRLSKEYSQTAIEAIRKKEKLISLFEADERFDYNQNEYINKYYNKSVAELVRNSNAKKRITIQNNKIIQLYDLIFFPPPKPSNPLDYRTHNYSPTKYFMGIEWPTQLFNVLVIWSFTVFFFVTLYFNLPAKTVKLFERQ